MALVIPPGFIQLVYRFTLTGDPEEMVTTLGSTMTGFANGNAAVDAAAADFILAVPATAILLGYTFVGVRGYVGQDGGPPTVHESVTGPVAGSNAGPALPPNCAFLLQKRTALGGRRNRGRMFIPAGIGVGEDSVPATGVMGEAQRAALEDRYDNAFNRGGPVIFHDSTTPGTTTPTPVTSFSCQARLATVRRRLRP